MVRRKAKRRRRNPLLALWQRLSAPTPGLFRLLFVMLLAAAGSAEGMLQLQPVLQEHGFDLPDVFLRPLHTLAALGVVLAFFARTKVDWQRADPNQLPDVPPPGNPLADD